MSGVCTICNHNSRIEIDRSLASGISCQKIANEFGVDSQAVRRHRDNHLTRQLVTALEKKQLTESMALLSRIEGILVAADDIFRRNYEKGKDGLALKALAEQRSTIELLARIAAFLHENRAAELQSSKEAQAEAAREDLKTLSVDELHILRSLSLKAKSRDIDRRVRIPYSYVGRKERELPRQDYEKLHQASAPVPAAPDAFAEEEEFENEGGTLCPHGHKLGADFDEREECDNCEFRNPQAYAACGECGPGELNSSLEIKLDSILPRSQRSRRRRMPGR